MSQLAKPENMRRGVRAIKVAYFLTGAVVAAAFTASMGRIIFMRNEKVRLQYLIDRKLERTFTVPYVVKRKFGGIEI